MPGTIHRAGDDIATSSDTTSSDTTSSDTDCGAAGSGDEQSSPTLPDDIRSLFAEYRESRRPELRNELVMRYLHLADRCARRYTNRGEPVADLVQVSRMALVRAVERFDPDRGVRFEAFASPTILGEIRHHFRDNCWIVSVPRRAKELRSQVFRAAEQIGQQLGRQPTDGEVAEALGIETERVTTTMESNRHYRAASWESVADSGARTQHPASSSSAEPSDHTALVRLDVAHLLHELDERLQRIVIWRFYEECTQREIGERLGIGQVQVSRLLARAMEQLRSHADDADLTPEHVRLG